MGVFDLHSARARRSARRSSADVAEFVKTGVAMFGQIEQGARALIPVTAAAMAAVAGIREAAKRCPEPRLFDALNEAARNAGAALRELGALAGALENGGE
jgi:hypothetical protein